jgi:hypothetical protein
MSLQHIVHGVPCACSILCMWSDVISACCAHGPMCLHHVVHVVPCARITLSSWLNSIGGCMYTNRVQHCTDVLKSIVSLESKTMAQYTTSTIAMLCWAVLCMLCCSPVSSQEVALWRAGTEGCTTQPSRIGQSHTPGFSSCTSYTLLSASGVQSPRPCLEPTTGPIPAS